MRRRFAAAVAVGSALLAGCRSDGRDLRPPTQPLPATTTTTTAAPAFATRIDGEPRPPVSIAELASPANAIAEATGSGAVGGDQVTVDGAPADVLSFTIEADSSFLVRVRIEQEGPHTVCVGDACGRVFTLAPDADSPEQIEALIDQARQDVLRYLDHPRLFPDWTIVVGDPLSGVGGSIDPIARTVIVYRNRDRTVDDFVRTILHEFGHVVDAERLDDQARATYRELTGVAPGVAWGGTDSGVPEQDWADRPSEDFAELMVAWWSGGRWVPRTRTSAPDAQLLSEVGALTGMVPPFGIQA